MWRPLGRLVTGLSSWWQGALAQRQAIDWPRVLYARVFIAGVMIIMGLGRWGAFTSISASNTLPVQVYGSLLLILGVALWVTHPWRYSWPARLVDGLAAILLAAMAWDVGYVGVTSLLEGLMAISLASHCLFNHDCD